MIAEENRCNRTSERTVFWVSCISSYIIHELQNFRKHCVVLMFFVFICCFFQIATIRIICTRSTQSSLNVCLLESKVWSVHACQQNMHKANGKLETSVGKMGFRELKKELKRITDTHTHMEHGVRELRVIMD